MMTNFSLHHTFLAISIEFAWLWCTMAGQMQLQGFVHYLYDPQHSLLNSSNGKSLEQNEDSHETKVKEEMG